MPGAISTGQFPGAGLTTAGTGLNLSDALNVFALRPDLNLAVTIKALEQQGLLQILAEPNLVTSDGKEARFMVGGEFPVPVPQAGSAAGAITIQFREFGIRLSFLPTLTPNGTVRLHVLPEVSSIDIVNAITLNGFNIPALSTRRVETDVELEQGQSFVIAGLVDDRVTENLSRVPGLSDIPLFGALFKSRQRLKSKTELVVLVTPTVRHPLGSGEDPPLPAMPVPFLPPTENSSALNSPYLQQLQHTLIHSLIEMFESGSPHNPAAPVAQQTAAGQRPSDILIRHFQDLSLRYGSEHPDVRKAADVAALALDMEEEAEQEKTNHEKK
jgi:pilus assembly protein CpaC